MEFFIAVFIWFVICGFLGWAVVRVLALFGVDMDDEKNKSGREG